VFHNTLLFHNTLIYLNPMTPSSLSEQFRGIHQGLLCNPCRIASVSINILFQVPVFVNHNHQNTSLHSHSHIPHASSTGIPVYWLEYSCQGLMAVSPRVIG